MSKRDQIMTAALGLFIENGFDKTPTSAISKAAGVATGTLFHHFKTKEDLINALYEETKFSLRDLLAPALMGQTDIKQIHHDLWFMMLAWTLENPEKYRFLHQFGESALISANTREKTQEAFSDFCSLVETAIEKGIFRPLPVDMCMGLMSSHLYASSNYLLENRELWDNEAFREQLFGSYWNTLAAT